MYQINIEKIAFLFLILVWGASVFLYLFIYSAGVETMCDWSEMAKKLLLIAVILFFFSFFMSVRFSSSKFLACCWTAILVGFVPFLIFDFAIIYSVQSIQNSPDLQAEDYLYYSIVTFTTLGYGDFQPRPEFRLIAASQAFLGFTFVPVMISEFISLADKFRRP